MLPHRARVLAENASDRLRGLVTELADSLALAVLKKPARRAQAGAGQVVLAEGEVHLPQPSFDDSQGRSTSRRCGGTTCPTLFHARTFCHVPWVADQK
jgi:hypothetical protein